MSKSDTPRRIHVPVRFVDGVWECALGGAVPVKSGTEAELIVDAARITDKAFLEAMDRRVLHRVLGEGEAFLVALTVKPEAKPSEALRPYLKSFEQLQRNIATDLLDPYNPATLFFVEVTLSKPDKRQAKALDTRDGGLWLVTQGLRTTGIKSTTIILPPPVSDKPAASLNHALTLLSEKYETWRMAHTGNVYSRVLYQAKSGRWYPLEVLRYAAIEDQAHAIGGQLWDEFMKKMQALRDAPRRT